jgi:hypothetical protein
LLGRVHGSKATTKAQDKLDALVRHRFQAQTNCGRYYVMNDCAGDNKPSRTDMVSTAVIGGDRYTASGSSAPNPRFPAGPDCTEGCTQIRPKYIALTSTDGATLEGTGSTSAAHYKPIRWQQWSLKHASAKAIIAIDPCGCAADGDIPTASMTVKLTAPMRVGGSLIFTLMTLVDVKPLPGKHIRKPGIDGYRTRYHVRWSPKMYLWQNPI